MLLRAEIDAHAGKAGAASLFDLEKFFDSVEVGQLIPAALQLGFPRLILCLALQVALAPRFLVTLCTASLALLHV